MAGEFMQIVGADGRFMSDTEGRLALIVAGLEDGSMASEEVYRVGAGLYSQLAAVRPQSPAVQRFSRLNPAMFRPMPANFPHFPMAPSAPSGQHVQTVSPGELREVVQGLDTGAVLVAAGASFVITFNASMLFRPTRLMVGPSVAPLWTIDDIRVAADSLFLSSGPVPAEAFLPDAVTASALKRRTAQPGTPVQVQVTNIDAAAHRFRGALYGAASDASSCAV